MWREPPKRGYYWVQVHYKDCARNVEVTEEIPGFWSGYWFVVQASGGIMGHTQMPWREMTDAEWLAAYRSEGGT